MISHPETSDSPMPLICVVGGAGYIGSHMVMLLRSLQYRVVVIDDLSNGFQSSLAGAQLEKGSILDSLFLERFFSNYEVDAIIHFASSIQVGESVRHPQKYYKNNLTGTLNLLEHALEHGIKKIIFSSTAAVFGSPRYVPIDEAHPHEPLSPYGKSKLFVEQILADYEVAYGLRSVCLRYFNAAGASSCGTLGERHDPETHLIPLLLQQASGRLAKFSIFGDDYDTPDGTCIRDYIHVEDLCAAHLLALEYLGKGNTSALFNLGTGKGHSVSEVIQTVEEVTGSKLNISVSPKRLGDPAVLVADGSRAKSVLGWEPKYVDLQDIIRHAWSWEQKYPWQ